MILIRADGGGAIGSGHIMRCLSVAGALKEQGKEVLFVLADDSAAALLNERGQQYRILHTDYHSMEDELPALLPVLEECRPELFLADGYFVTAAYLERVGKHTKTAYIDDMCAFPCPADALINYNIYGEMLPYREQSLPQNRMLLLGCAYTPLRTEFRDVVYSVRERVENVLITTGGSDKYNLTGQILQQALSDAACRHLRYHVISGSFNSNLSGLRAVAEHHDNVQIHVNVHNMAELMKQCDIAVTAGGSTMYELCAVGVPIVCFSFVDNQERLVETFVKKRLACYGGNYLKENEELSRRVVEHVRLLADAKALREDYSHREKGLVDGKGAERIAKELTGLMEEN
ncbi:MAG: UDP-2,4-diacetamido-2,4,6-trideoxy-beta-L-altropyranose hydrolase [Lachnospiraceae bacterium]|nr:UDP-2,4-diacetamido-2,4,6-trideoxy-beta-L-altropyranose hydrolase [Lachnospiraceae bacterium]